VGRGDTESTWYISHWLAYCTSPDDYGELGGMRIGRGNPSTRRAPAPVPLCSSRTTHDLTWDWTRQLTAWALIRLPTEGVMHPEGMLRQCILPYLPVSLLAFFIVDNFPFFCHDEASKVRRSPSELPQAVTLLTCIPRLCGSNLDRVTDHSAWGPRGFCSLVSCICQVPQSLASASFAVHYSLILPFDAVSLRPRRRR
jgi:hypothetical protein